MAKQAYLLDLDLLKAAFAERHEEVINELYFGYREEYVGFARKMTSDSEKIIDSYQDSIIALHENLVWNKITENNSTVKTYLFSIGKNKLLNAINKEKVAKNHDDLYIKQVQSSLTSEFVSEDMKEELLVAIQKLGETCQKLLQYFYYKKYSIEAIMHTMNMKNENSVKANKSRCVRQLRDILENENGKNIKV